MGARGLVIGLVALFASGCGGYANTSEAFRKSLSRGDPNAALAAANQALGVKDAKDLPRKGGPDTPLLLLERATILQALGEYKLSERDFQAADKNLEVLDLTSDTAGSIGKYLYSDDATVYKAPPHEKLLVNTLNMVNYLAQGNTNGAKIEARRLLVNQKYLKDAVEGSRGIMALGSYLAGFSFEMDGSAEEAMRHYGDCLQAGGVPTLAESVRRLHNRTGASDKRLERLFEDGSKARVEKENSGEVLVIVQVGMAPFKVPERVPIGAAVVSATQPGPGARLSSKQRRKANMFAAKGILKFVNYPKLRRYKQASRRRVQVSADGKRLNGGQGLNIVNRVEQEYKQIEGSLMAAAITRLISRAVAGELSQAAASRGKKNNLLGTLVGLATEAALTAADTPDTRSWVTLPGHIHIARSRVPAGPHTVQVNVAGYPFEATVDVPAGGYKVVNFSAQR